ncbi:MAG TPA: DUF4345 family protein [Luteimonas sp.]|nr:DUF4345 family protein [Luteimonas sp.]
MTRTFVLRICAALMAVPVALHTLLGVRADRLLGIETAFASPGADSQSRFFGASLALYAWILWRCADAAHGDDRFLRPALWILFFSGLARIPSIFLFGWPPAAVVGLLISEIAIPPAVLLYLDRISSREAGHE